MGNMAGMNLIDLSLRRPVFAWVLMFSLIVFGAIAMNRMGVSQMPDVNFPVLNISINYEGAAPEVVEADLIDPLEEVLLNVEGIKEMRSGASQGSGRITLEFDIERNIDVALQEVQSAISQYRLPPGVDPPVIRKQNPEEDPILIISVYSDRDLKELLNWIDGSLLDQIRFIPGVGEVDVGGFSERNLRIWFDRQKLNQFDLTVSDVVDAIRSQHRESAAGQFSEKDRELRVRWLGEGESSEQVGDVRVLRRGGQLIFDREIRIKDVARVEDGLSDIRRLARYKDKQTIALRIKKQRGTNEVKVAEAIRNRLELLKESFPKDVDYRVNVDFTLSTKSTVELTTEKMWVAAFVTILVCFLFLGNYQAALNILFSIPTSIFGTFLILHFSGFTLNLFTLLALTLSVSIVVDDAIMLLENIVRHYRMGKSARQAAYDGSIEVLPAATAATLAVVAIFLPVVFMDGVVGKFFYQFGITMSAAVLLSLLEAVTITPMRAAAFLSASPKISPFEHWLDGIFGHWSKVYSSSLAKALNWKFLVLVAAMSVFLGSLFLLTKVRREFVPAQDQDILLFFGQTAPGSSLEFTNEKAKELEKLLANVPEIDGFIMSVGAGGPGGGGVNSVFVPAKLTPRAERKVSHTELMDRLRGPIREIKGLRMSMRDISARNLSAGRQNPLAISLRGPDLNILDQKSNNLIAELEKSGLAVDLDTDYRVGVPELVLRPDRQKMALAGVSAEDVGRVLSASVGGLREGRFTGDGRRYDIRFKFPDSEIRSDQDITSIFVRNTFGNRFPLSEFVSVKEGQAPQAINRVNRQRAISVFGNIATGQSQAKVLEEAGKIARKILPEGYSFAFEGASAGFNQSFQSLNRALLIGVLVAYLILAVQFNSFILPVSVLMALPFSITGALLALWMFDESLNLFSFIGLILLMGISKKNSILLVEFANQLKARKGLTHLESILQSGAVRLRPIVMTSVATVAAALPLVIGTSLGSETRLPMGLAIIGGT